MSRNTIKIVLESEFDSTITHIKSKVGMIACPQRRYYPAST